MSASAGSDPAVTTMKVLHIFRAPVGGLFRHVRDLARGQAELGLEVGAICDSTTGDALAEQKIEQLASHCSLGVHRVPMSRLPGMGDIASASRIVAACRTLQPDVAHGHGAKGGVYARLGAARLGAASVYTPHGGVLHYEWASPQGLAFLSAEKLLLRKTTGLVFVCDYEKELFRRKIGLGKARSTVAHNGLWDEEFEPVPLEDNATDILFIGELRQLKGVSELLESLAIINRVRKVTATITGSGPDEAAFKVQAGQLGLSGVVRFTGALPAREAFAKGWLMVIPSRAESFPYIVLETAAAAKPLLATRVGGVAEVLDDAALMPPNAPQELASRIAAALDDRTGLQAQATERALRFKGTLSARQMSAKIAAFYTSLLR
jgi:glycosyltransferase involved in cell wall biosynthesis